jgi:Predicted periplasmic protein
MRKALSFLMLCAASALMASCAPKPGSLEISFNYNKQAGPGSNQYAVWIENAQGEVVKTLFVTEFTAKGRSRDGSKPQRGYTYRTSCVPTWVKHVDAENLTDERMDAFTGATPAASGVQTFTWDFTDQAGKMVPKGTYRFYVEATYSGASVVTHCGEVVFGAPAADLPVETAYIEKSEDRIDMITDVKARKL